MVTLQRGQLILQDGDFRTDTLLLLEVAFQVTAHLGGVLRCQVTGGGVLGHDADLSAG
ncbi:hypothetical protein [Streptomyces sp. F001]|uniref:hypothetical protein n=1 Tax=Streptomyces sp. F001 TaxID=1510026 RepID=UPI001F11530A|nr:hypothetical protein [Streptomyces sp. F001]